MWTSSIHRARVGPNLWEIVSFVLIPLAWAGDSTTVTKDSCGTYIYLVTGSHAIHWKGDILRNDCTIYIQNEPTYENTLCAEAMKYDVKDKRFILTFLSGTSYNEDTKYFTAFENKSNISYCARKQFTLALQFSTGTNKSDSHVYLKITRTPVPFNAGENEGLLPRERLPQVMYRLMGGIGSAIMVALLASVLVKRRRTARNLNFGRGGIVIRRAGETNDEQRGEEMVALHQSSQNNPGTFPEAGVPNGYSGPSPMYPTQQPIRPPAYSEIQSDPANFKQYPDSAPPSYEDVADSRTDYTKTEPNTSNK